MDNKIFNINGKTKNQLKLALTCLLTDEYNEEKTVTGWYFSKKNGLVLTWFIKDEKTKCFTDRLGNPRKVNSDELANTLWEWLKTDEAKTVELGEWENKIDDDDIETELGWRLYTNEWGHVKNEDGYSIDNYSIAAFKPNWLWYGK